jgi:release factor glutamine methyltransferase
MTKETEWLLREKYRGEKSEAFFADCTRLEAGEPLAYLIGSIPFLGCEIALDSHPLIPRPETEFWTEKAITEIRAQSSRQDLVLRGLASNSPSIDLSRGWTPKILDLCAGSGAIGVAVAKAIPEAHVTFAELDPAHLPTIQKNINQNLSVNRKVLGEEYEIVASDLFTNITGRFDFILTNPPYIDQAANTVDDSVATHEPHLALFGGEDGLAIITEIITKAPDYLTANGQLWIEHEPFQSATIRELASLHRFGCQTLLDQYDTARYSILTLGVAK